MSDIVDPFCAFVVEESMLDKQVPRADTCQKKFVGELQGKPKLLP